MCVLHNRVKYARAGRAKHRIMTPLELLARIAAILPPRSAWRKTSSLAEGQLLWERSAQPHVRVTGCIWDGIVFA
jgi:hypothetical protein